MNNDMKSDAGTDPIDDASATDENEENKNESDDEDDTSGSPLDASLSHWTQSTSSSDSTDEITTDDLPYVITRNRVKENRTMISYFLRPETQELEDEAEEIVAKELGTDVQRLDLREALVLVGLNNIEEVVDTLRDFGYRLKE